MNVIDISVYNIDIPPWLEAVEAFFHKILHHQGISNWEVSVVFCDDSFIRDLNKRFRDKDEATDVLSFGQGTDHLPEDVSPYVAGDIVVSVDTLSRNAEACNIPFEEELKRLIVHGFLHLYGFDHETNDADEEMLVLQEKILNVFTGEKII